MSAFQLRERAYGKKYRLARPLAVKAVQAVAQLYYKGKLPYLRYEYVPCVDCGKRAEHYDHRDYTKPLEVEPVCRSCNKLRGPAHPYIGIPVVVRTAPYGNPKYLRKRNGNV